ncbi:MAG: hypothetical protein PWP28_48 [Oceanotoga sp.]|jgi:hypothetical protein|nr:hypothetical protein [Oceanotoga sp.]MDO7976854.1 hypothetical protein [Oceanotoga teriensis]
MIKLIGGDIMKGTFNKDLKKLIDNSDFSFESLSKELKMPAYMLQDFINNKLDGYSKVQIDDICSRLNIILDENILFFPEESEKLKKEKKDIKFLSKNKKNFFILILITFSLITCIYIYKIYGEMMFYQNIISKNNISINIQNLSSNTIVVEDIELKPNEYKNIILEKNKKIKILNNTGTVKIKSPFDEYNIKLDDFEVVLTDGEN